MNGIISLITTNLPVVIGAAIGITVIGSIVLALTQIAMPLDQFFYGALLERYSNMMFIPFSIAAILTAITAFSYRWSVKSENKR